MNGPKRFFGEAKTHSPIVMIDRLIDICMYKRCELAKPVYQEGGENHRRRDREIRQRQLCKRRLWSSDFSI